MIDRHPLDPILSALLAFAVLVAATGAIAAAWFEQPPAATATLPRVEVIGKRAVPVQIVASCEPASVAATLPAPRC